MYIKSEVACQLGWEYPDRHTFSAYYDTAEDWHTLSAFYLERPAVELLRDYFLGNEDSEVSICVSNNGDCVVLVEAGVTKEIPFEMIHVHNGPPVKVWPFMLKDTWFDAILEDDDRIFTWSDIEEAVIHGVAMGLQAAREETVLIKGLTPSDYAKTYSRELEGS